MGRKGRGQGSDMATIEERRGGWRLVFWYQSQRFQGAIKAKDRRAAENTKARVEQNLQLLLEGRIEYNAEKDDLFTLMISDGKLNQRPEATKRITLGEFFEQYQVNRPPGKEGNTTYTEDIHVAHILRLLGTKIPLAEVPEKIQEYVTLRSQEKNRSGDPISQTTVKKELGSLTAIWNKWALQQKIVSFPLTLRNISYSKKKEKPPFQTWEQIERRIARGNLSQEQQDELWNCLYLSVPEVEEFLAWVKANGCLIRETRRVFPWVYPMLALCAYTGARRSEMLRSRLEDIDFESNVITIREKKKDTSKEETFRHVPMPSQLRAALQEWLAIHPGGAMTFCKKPDEPFTAQMTQHYFEWAGAGGKWKVVRGWHVLRHSLVSNLAQHGVSERVIMEIVGHLNRETTRRYLHLRPATLDSAMELLFGKAANQGQ